MIEFKQSSAIEGVQQMTHAVAEALMRPISRQYDEQEHEKPWDFMNQMWGASKGSSFGGGRDGKGAKGEAPKASEQNLRM